MNWLKTFCDLPPGIPALDAEAFQGCFARWVEAVFQVTRGQVIVIDGKTVRRSHDRTIGKDTIHMVSAWATNNGIVLGAVQSRRQFERNHRYPGIVAGVERRWLHCYD